MSATLSTIRRQYPAWGYALEWAAKASDKELREVVRLRPPCALTMAAAEGELRRRHPRFA